MFKLFKIALILSLVVATLVESRTLYYPDTKDPNAIVFEGPTNYIPDVTENEVDPDYSKLINIRIDNEGCPPGFEMVGQVCFPND